MNIRLLLLLLLYIASTIWVVNQVWNVQKHKYGTDEKIVWTLLALLPLITAAIYYLLERNRNNSNTNNKLDNHDDIWN